MSQVKQVSFNQAGKEYIEHLDEILGIIKRARSRHLEGAQLKIMLNRQFVGVLNKYNTMVRAYGHTDTDLMFDIVSEAAEILQSMLSHITKILLIMSHISRSYHNLT